MKKYTFIAAIIVLTMLSAFFGAGGSQFNQALAAPTTLATEAGITAYANIGAIADINPLKTAFLTIEYQALDNSFFIGKVDMAHYADEYDPYVLVHSAGWIVAYYPAGDPAGKMVDVIGRTLDETLLEKAVKAVGLAGGLTLPAISHYDFANITAAKLQLVAEYQADGDAFTLNLPSTTNTYYQKSYGFYRYYEPSFTLDNDFIDQVNFVLTNADYFNPAVYGTIYGHFGDEGEVDFEPGVTHTFTVWNRDFYAFGALAIEYSGDALFTIADADYEREILLTAPTGLPEITFDYTPSDFVKYSPIDTAIDQRLDVTLEWYASTAPSYEYCIDTTAPDPLIPEDNDCATEWISTGSETSVDLSNLFYDTIYYWQVRASNSTATTYADGGAWWSFTTGNRVDPEPFIKLTTELTQPIDSLSKVTMTWEPSYGTYYYEVCVDTTAVCIAPELWHNVGLATTASIGDLLLDTTYFWQVRAANYDDNGVYYTYADLGTWATFTTRTFSKIRPVDEAVHYPTLPLEWEPTPIATSYEYCVDTSAPDLDPNTDDCGAIWKPVGLSTSVVAKKLLTGTYYWQVRAKISANVYEYANDGDWWEFTILAKNSKITLFKVSPLNGAVEQPITNLVLSWKSTKITTGYEYCYFPIDDTDTTPISDDDTCSYDDPDDPYDYNWVSTGTDTSATISGLSNAVTYYWQVRANIGTLNDPVWIYADKGDYWAFTTAIAQ